MEKSDPVYEKVFLDSLETAAWFQQDANTAIQELYLWVEGQKVRGELQKRELASAQYESIVQRRKDPAILETHGNGYYNLKVFPLETGRQRRIEIQFRQGLEDGASGFSTALPVLFGGGQFYRPGGSVTAEERAMGSVRVSARSGDGKAYSLEWEGLGALTLGPQPQTLTAEKVTKLGIGRITDRTPCAGCPSAWTGSLAGQAYFGFKTLLERSTLTFDPEPANRLFLLDVPESAGAEVLERAKKLALMAIKTYAEGHKFQVAFAGGNGGKMFVFDQYVELNPTTLNTAYEALSEYSGSPEAASHDILRALLTQSVWPVGSPALLLFSGQPAPVYPIGPPDKTTIDPEDRTVWSAWQEARNAWYLETQDTYAKLAETFNDLGINLFGFFDDYMLSQTAYQTGGYQHGTLRNGYYHWYLPAYDAPIASAGTAAVRPAPAQWHLPPLYGPGRPGNPGPQNLEVTTTGVDVGNLALLWQRQWYYGFPAFDLGRPGVMTAEPAVMMKTSSRIAPCCFDRMDSAEVRLSGTYAAPGALTAVFTGTWGGLGFSKTVTVPLGAPAPGNGGAAVWAGQKSEALRLEDYQGSVKAVQELGFAHHIVNSQVSLLALEPGMELWTELPNQITAQAGSREAVAMDDAALTAGSVPASAASTSLEVDRWTMEDILSGTSPVLPGAKTRIQDVRLRLHAQGAVYVSLEGIGDGEEVVFEILDLKGRNLAKLKGISRNGMVEVRWNPAAETRGIVIIRALFQNRVEVDRVLIPGDSR